MQVLPLVTCYLSGLDFSLTRLSCLQLYCVNHSDRPIRNTAQGSLNSLAGVNPCKVVKKHQPAANTRQGVHMLNSPYTSPSLSVFHFSVNETKLS